MKNYLDVDYILGVKNSYVKFITGALTPLNLLHWCS